MFRSGVKVAEIASALNVPAPTVLALLLRSGVDSSEFEGVWEVHEGGQVVDSATRAALVGEYTKWVPIGMIAEKFGLTKEMVWQVLLEEGVPVRRRRVMRELTKLRRDVEIVDMYLEGVEIWDIALAVGVNVATVNTVARKYNIPSRKVITKGKIKKTPELKGEIIHPRDLLRKLLDTP